MIKIIVLAVLVLSAAFEFTMLMFHVKSRNNPVPESVKNLYDEEKYTKWRQYQLDTQKYTFWKKLVGFIITFALMAFNLYALFSSLFDKNTYIQILMVVLLDCVVSLIYNIPFDYYFTFVIEEKFGFNRSTKKTFIADEIKNFIISFVINFALAAILAVLFGWIGNWVVLGLVIVLAVFTIGLSFLSPYFNKLFNKFTDLEDGELKEKLTALLTKNGYQVRKICIMDASRRTTKSNAYFTGFGKMKTIVLYDTLVNAMTPDEICAVFAHEMGHGLHKDILKLQILNLLNFSLMAGILALILCFDGFMKEFGFIEFNYAFAVILIVNLFGFISPLMQMLINAYSRKAEYRADHQAVIEGYGKDLESALKTLAKENLSDLSPSRETVILEYSHPPIADRLEAIEKDL